MFTTGEYTKDGNSSEMSEICQSEGNEEASGSTTKSNGESSSSSTDKKAERLRKLKELHLRRVL